MKLQACARGGSGLPGSAGLRRKNSRGHKLKNRNKAKKHSGLIIEKPDLSGFGAACLRALPNRRKARKKQFFENSQYFVLHNTKIRIIFAP